MILKNPSRPGDIVGHIIREAQLTVTEAAVRLGVTRQTLNNLINGKSASVSPEMAFRIAKVFGSSPEFWLRMQAGYDAAEMRKSRRAEKITRRLKRFAVAE